MGSQVQRTGPMTDTRTDRTTAVQTTATQTRTQHGEE